MTECMTLIECSSLGHWPGRAPVGVVMVPSTGDTPHPKGVEGLAAWIVGDEMGLLLEEERH